MKKVCRRCLIRCLSGFLAVSFFSSGCGKTLDHRDEIRTDPDMSVEEKEAEKGSRTSIQTQSLNIDVNKIEETLRLFLIEEKASIEGSAAFALDTNSFNGVKGSTYYEEINTTTWELGRWQLLPSANQIIAKIELSSDSQHEVFQAFLRTRPEDGSYEAYDWAAYSVHIDVSKIEETLRRFLIEEKAKIEGLATFALDPTSFNGAKGSQYHEEFKTTTWGIGRWQIFPLENKIRAEIRLSFGSQEEVFQVYLRHGSENGSYEVYDWTVYTEQFLVLD